MNTINTQARPGEYRIPPSAMTAQCKSCHAPIVWTRTSKNGKLIPLSMSTVRVDEQGVRWALNHFEDCPQADQHRTPDEPTTKAAMNVTPAAMDIRDLPAYLERHRLVVTGSTVTDDGNGHLHIELSTRRLT